MSKGYKPPREIQFTATPVSPGSKSRSKSRSKSLAKRLGGGRVVQFRVSATPDAQTAPASASVSSSAGASGPPQLIDADTGEYGALQEPSNVPAAPAGVAQGSTPASQQGVQMLILHAVSGWVAVVRERVVYSIQIAPMGSGTFEVEATLAAVGNQGVASKDPADLLYLRVSCSLGAGKLVRTEVQPLGPR